MTEQVMVPAMSGDRGGDWARFGRHFLGEGRAPRVAEQAAECLRELNYATLRQAGYTGPDEIADVAGSLHALVARLPQALAQASDWLEVGHVEGRIGVDADLSVDETVRSAIRDADEAIAAAHTLAHWLRALHTDASHLTGI